MLGWLGVWEAHHLNKLRMVRHNELAIGNYFIVQSSCATKAIIVGYYAIHFGISRQEFEGNYIIKSIYNASKHLQHTPSRNIQMDKKRKLFHIILYPIWKKLYTIYIQSL